MYMLYVKYDINKKSFNSGIFTFLVGLNMETL